MKALFKSLLLMGLMLSFSACHGDESQPQPNTDVPEKTEPGNQEEVGDTTTYMPAVSIPLKANERSMVTDNNAFAMRLMAELIKADTLQKDIICSPLSITYVLGMVTEGATDETLSEILTALGFDTTDPHAVSEFCATMLTNAPLADRTVTLNVANALFLNHFVTLLEPYRQYVQDKYQATVDVLDFADPASLDYINAWCKRQTNGIIPKILDELNEDAIAYLANAIYFKARWQDEFKPVQTTERIFTRPDNQEVYVPMMHKQARISYAETDAYQAVRLPYGNGAYKMTIVLPVEGQTPEQTLANIASDGLARMTWWDDVIVDLQLPRFESKSEMQLKEILEALGISRVFTDKAQLTNITGYPLFISKILQKARIIVKEEGAEAAAVTIAQMDATANIDPEPPLQRDVHCNRPFLYFITEESTDAIFFMGVYNGIDQ